MASAKLMREAKNPATTPARLQEIAQEDRSTWTTIAANPSAYPGLLEWLTEHGDDEVRAAVTAREAAVTPPPPPPPAPAAPPAPPAPPTPPAPSATDDTLVVPPTAGVAATESAPGTDTGTGTGTGTSAEGDSKKNTMRAVGILVAVALVVGGGFYAANALGGDDDDKPSIGAGSKSDDDDEKASGGSKSDFCAAMKNVQEIGLEAAKDMPSGDATPDLEDVTKDAAAQLEKMDDAYDQLAKSAPNELKADVAVLTKYFDNLSDMASGDVDEDDPFDSSDMDGYLEASQNITKYYYTKCS